MNVLERLGRAILDFESESEKHIKTIGILKAVVEGKIAKERFSFHQNGYTLAPEKPVEDADAKS